MTFKVSVDGNVYDGWTVARITRSLTDFAHGITLNYIDRWAPEAAAWPIRRGNTITPFWGTQPYTAGRVDVSKMSVDQDAWQLSVVARSFTGALVDCSAIHETGHWTDATIATIATDLCRPFGIKVTCASPGDPLPRFTLRQGESVNDALNRLCKLRSAIPVTTTDGQLELFSIDSPVDMGLELPILPFDVEAALSRTYSDDGTGRYSQYLLHATGIDDAADAFDQHVAEDLEVEHFRPLVVVSDAGANAAQMESRAIWEANVRAARGETLSYVMQSPLNILKKLYHPGQRYQINDDAFGVSANMLLHSVADSPEQMRTEVSFVRPEAYARYDVVGKARKKLVRASKRPKRTRRPQP